MAGAFNLIFETTTPHASLATVVPGNALEQRLFTSDRSHNAVLFSPLKELLGAHNIFDLELVLVGSGPGSYSGTRVGIAAAQGVAMAAGCPAVAIPSILAVPSALNGSPCLAIGDARRGSFWIARMENFSLAEAPQLTDAAGLKECVSVAVTNGVPVVSFETPERFPLSDELRGQVKLEFPDAEGLWKVWNATSDESRSKWLSEIPQPIYLKPPHITPAKRPWLVQPHP